MAKLLDILLQRNDTAVPWGFQVRSAGGPAGGRHPIISTVTFGTLAAQYLNAGDKILEIEKRAADSLAQWEIERMLDSGHPRLQLLVEKLPAGTGAGGLRNRVTMVEPQKALARSKTFNEVVTEKRCVREKEANEKGVKHSTKIWLREKKKNPSLGEYDLEVNFERTKYKNKLDDPSDAEFSENLEESRNLKRMQVFSENVNKIFRDKIGEWLETNILGVNDSKGKPWLRDNLTRKANRKERSCRINWKSEKKESKEKKMKKAKRPTHWLMKKPSEYVSFESNQKLERVTQKPRLKKERN